MSVPLWVFSRMFQDVLQCSRMFKYRWGGINGVGQKPVYVWKSITADQGKWRKWNKFSLKTFKRNGWNYLSGILMCEVLSIKKNEI